MFGSKMLKSTVALLGMAVGALLVTQMWQSASAEGPEITPYSGDRAQAEEVEQARTRSPEDLFQMAQGKMEEGKLEKAAFITTALLMEAPQNDAFKLYVKIQEQMAEKSLAEENYGDASGHYEEALKAIEHWKEQVISSSAVEEETVALIFDLEERINDLMGEMAQDVIEKAETMRDEARRWPNSWALRDDREQIIDALILLDSLNPDNLSRDIRKRHSEIWTEYYGALGEAGKEKYKTRSNLENG